jgi:DNA-directed RNA polymerase specialized sigma24 family protein
MTDLQIEPSALVDAYGDELFRYCWFLLRSREAAEIAVRDALVVAVAHGGQLLDPGRLRPWLYALARTECRRRRPLPPGAADEPPARPSQPDADSRVVAWNAVTSMASLSSEMLELLARHQMSATDIALVTGMTAPEVEVVLASAREELGWSLAAHLVVRRMGFDCTGLTAAVRGWAGTMTAAIRARVLAHTAVCEVCEHHLPRRVSAARVFGLLPVPDPGPGTRDVLLTRLTDEQHAGDRTLVARRAEQSAALAALAAGTPPGDRTPALPPMPPPPPIRRRRRGAVATRVAALSGGKLLAGIAAAGMTAAAAATIVLAGFPCSSWHSPTASRTASGAPSGGSQNAPSRIGVIGAAPVSHAPGSSSPPLLVAKIPGGQPPVHDGQPLYLSAAPQSGTPPVSVPRTAAPASTAAAPATSPPSSPAPIWSPPTMSPTPVPTATGGGQPASQGHRHRHRHSNGSGSGRAPGGGPPPAGGSSAGGGSSSSGSSSGSDGRSGGSGSSGSRSGGSGRTGGGSPGSRSRGRSWSGGGSAGDGRHGAAQQ